MPRASATGREKVGGRAATPDRWDIRNIFPDPPPDKGLERGPYPNQQRVFDLISRGECEGGGIVWQSGKGGSKTICGAATTIWASLRWQGLRSAVCRESYPAIVTSLWPDFEEMLKRVPDRLIAQVHEPSVNSMGWIDWTLGGTTLFLSLSNSGTWESANLGFVWVDEGHLQDGAIVEKLLTRIRQAGSPGCVLLTTNPGGQNYAWEWAHPDSESRLPAFHWIETSSLDNPALPDFYTRRLLAMYPPGSLAYDRWVLGKSTALEGSVFGEVFDPDPIRMVHVIPDFPIPDDWPRGRGIDSGIDNPTAVVWGALFENAWYIYRVYRARGLAASAHAERILALEENENVYWTPADPEIFRKIHPVPGLPEVFESTSDHFLKAGCRVTPANNDRRTGKDRLFELLAPDTERIHPCHLKPPAPRLFILNNQSTKPLVTCLEGLQWAPEAKTGSRGAPDEIRKKDDHEYDALRYLVMEVPDMPFRDAVARRDRVKRGSRGYRGY